MSLPEVGSKRNGAPGEASRSPSRRPKIRPYVGACVVLGAGWTAVLAWAAYRYGLRSLDEVKEFLMLMGRGWMAAAAVVGVG